MSTKDKAFEKFYENLKNGHGRRRNVKDIPIIKYKGIYHLHTGAFNAECGEELPFQGEHWKSKEYINIKDLRKIVNCVKCLEKVYK